MANNLDAVIPVMYRALDTVSRELAGFIPAVSRDSNAENAAKGQTIKSPVVPSIEPSDIEPGVTGNQGHMSVDTVDMQITKAQSAKVTWTGEDQLGVSHSEQLERIQEDRFVQAMRSLVNRVEADLAAEYTRASRAYGDGGVTPFDGGIRELSEIKKIMLDNGAPQDEDFHLVLNTEAGANLRSLEKLTNVHQAGTDDVLRRGELGRLYGFGVRESAQIASHSAGSGSDLSVSGSHSSGATEISVSGDASGLKIGDVVEIGDHKYVVEDGTGDKLKIRAPGLMESVSGDTSISVEGGYSANLAFHRSAIHLITRAPAMPDGGDGGDDVTEITDPDTGLAFQVAVYRQYRQITYEIGLAWGTRAVKPEHAALLLG